MPAGPVRVDDAVTVEGSDGRLKGRGGRECGKIDGMYFVEKRVGIDAMPFHQPGQRRAVLRPERIAQMARDVARHVQLPHDEVLHLFLDLGKETGTRRVKRVVEVKDPVFYAGHQAEVGQRPGRGKREMTGSTLDWAGTLGLEWADKTDPFDRLLGPLGAAAIAGLRPVAGEQVLDVGCGAGATSLALAEMGAVVTGVDISEHLLDVARARDTEGRCTFVEGDAATIEFARRFDALFSRCGMMFFPEPVAAFRHLRLAMRREGRLSVIAFRPAAENGWITRPLEILSPLLGDAASALPESGKPGPFAWGEPDHFHGILENAGWRDVTHQPVDADVVAGDGAMPVEAALSFCETISLARRLRMLTEEDRRAALEALREGLTHEISDGTVRFGTAGWLIQARAT